MKDCLFLTLTPDGSLLFGQAIMHTLLDYIKKDRLADALVEKLCLRFDAGGEDKSQSRNLAFCLAQVSLLPPSAPCKPCCITRGIQLIIGLSMRLWQLSCGADCCVSPLQLSISEKGFKKMVELHKHYKDQLLDPDVLASFQVRAVTACTWVR